MSKALRGLWVLTAALGLLALLGDGQRLLAAGAYPIWVSGVQVTEANRSDVLGDGSVVYEQGRLLLRNATLRGCSLHRLGNSGQPSLCGLYIGQPLELVVEGDCLVDVSGHGLQVDRSYGIYVMHECELTLSGTGTLSIVGGPARERSFGLRGYDPLRVRGQVVVRALGGTATNSRVEGVSNSYGIYARSMVVEGHADVSAWGGPAVKSFGVYCEGGELTVAGDGVLEASGKTRALTAVELSTDERNRATAWVNGTERAEGAVRGMQSDFDTYGYVRLGDAGNPFGDVHTTDPYHDAVLWAVEAGVAAGLSDTVFGPMVGCSRGQVLTFLWRAMGSPEPQQSIQPFRDVAADGYYSKAVLWAVEQGITTGTGPDSFSPEQSCTQAQILVFLWRAMGQPAGHQEGPLAQVYQEHYYGPAVGWAEETGLLAGRFLPEQPSVRADIVTWLHRLLGERPPEPEPEVDEAGEELAEKGFFWRHVMQNVENCLA